MKTLLRWLFAIPLILILIGCWFYFATQLIGGGLHLDPMPGIGMLIAGAALVVMIGGYLDNPLGEGGVDPRQYH